MSRAYKDHKIYCCFTLNRLVAELGIDLYQQDLESKLDRLLTERPHGVSKEEVKHEIRSNHFMTNKVIEKLVEDGLVTVDKEEGRYQVRITKTGVIYIRKYNEFFLSIYAEQIRDHYRYRGLPHWARDAEK
jgi:predicted transcriptional regulator